MKFLSALLFIFSFSFLFSQDITGDWHGKLDVNGMPLRVVFHISKVENTYSSTMDSPDQNAFGIPITSTAFSENTLTIISKEMSATYTATFIENKFEGVFDQMNNKMPLILSREALDKTVINRPQEPKPKFNYVMEEVKFTNSKDSVTLAGTLTLPKGKGPFPVAILISGSGPQDRNEEILGHKPFLVIADYLTNNGIAILRYDDRGSFESTGDFSTATSLDFARDVEAAVAFLKTKKNIHPKKIGLIGHSEGGLIAPIVASRPENEIAFLISLAGPGISGKEIIIMQQELISRAEGMSEEEIAENTLWSTKVFQFMEQNLTSTTLDSDLKQFIIQTNEELEIEIPEEKTAEEVAQSQFDAISGPWMKYFLFYNPTDAWEKVTCPILALNGEKDLQVPVNENLNAIKESTASNKNVTIVPLANLNHLFQTSETGSPSEYGKIEETFSEDVLKMMVKWLNELKLD